MLSQYSIRVSQEVIEKESTIAWKYNRKAEGDSFHHSIRTPSATTQARRSVSQENNDLQEQTTRQRIPPV